MKNREKPHIIIINPDEMRWDTMGHMGNPAAQTPNLDRFAEQEAVSFRNAYCQNAVCVPSRCSFLTGLYPHVRGHRTMQYLLREDETSIFKELKEKGYYVWMNGRNDLVAGQREGLVQSHADEIYYYDKSKPAQVLNPADLKGFMAQKETKKEFPYSHFKGKIEKADDGDMQDTKAAIRRIMNPADDRPLCLFLGWTNPHPPYAAEEPFYSAIDRSKLWPRIKPEELKNKSLMLQKIRENADMDEYSEEQWDELRAVYLAQCSKVDAMFGMVCDALKDKGIYDDCAIFFLSDHGDFTGDYGLPEKAQNTFEDCLMKVPLLMKPPKKDKVDAGVSDSLVELIDFYATAMDYAGVEPDHDQFGISLRKVIEDRTNKVREFVFSEGGRMAYEIQCDEWHSKGANGTAKSNEYWPKHRAQTDPLAHEKGTMIFDGRYKYVQRPSGRNEFYDLSIDAKETTNLFEEKKNSKEVLRLCMAMLDWYQQTCDNVPREYDSRFTSERIWAIARKLCPAECEEQVRDFIKNGASVEETMGYCMRLLMQVN